MEQVRSSLKPEKRKPFFPTANVPFVGMSADESTGAFASFWPTMALVSSKFLHFNLKNVCAPILAVTRSA